MAEARFFFDFIVQAETWKDRGACHPSNRAPDVDPSIFFPTKGTTTKQARAICAKCPVRVECEEYAQRTDSTYGVWGGVIRKRYEPTESTESTDEPDQVVSLEPRSVRALPGMVEGGLRAAAAG